MVTKTTLRTSLGRTHHCRRRERRRGPAVPRPSGPRSAPRSKPRPARRRRLARAPGEAHEREERDRAPTRSSFQRIFPHATLFARTDFRLQLVPRGAALDPPGRGSATRHLGQGDLPGGDADLRQFLATRDARRRTACSPRSSPPSLPLPPRCLRRPRGRAHPEPGRGDEGRGPNTKTESRWYGYQTLASDAAAVALLPAMSAGSDSEPVSTTAGVLGLATYAVAPAIIHGVHGHPGKAVGDTAIPDPRPSSAWASARSSGPRSTRPRTTRA